MDDLTRLQLALVATRPGVGRGLAGRVQREGHEALVALVDGVQPGERRSIRLQAEELRGRGIGALIHGVGDYPKRLSRMKDAPPALFYSGPVGLLSEPAIGICGARNVSQEGLRAAAVCGKLAAGQGIVSVSGYARGVDTSTHVSSLESGGATVIVLPDGINHFKVKREGVAPAWDPDRVLILSQFAPTQTWSAGAAMARNSVIIGLGMALVVVEAGETGGTLAAGTKALRLHRRVLTLEFSSFTPAGNMALLDQGAIAVHGADELSGFLSDLVHVADDSEGSDTAISNQYALSVDLPESTA